MVEAIVATYPQEKKRRSPVCSPRFYRLEGLSRFSKSQGTNPLKMSAGDRVLIVFMAVVLIASIGLGITAQIGSGSCEKRASALAAAYSWDIGTGCYIEIEPNRWVPLNRL